MIELKGIQHKTVIVDGGTIRIVKGGMFGARDKTIPIRSIGSVEVKKPGLVNGYIQFSIAGGKHHNSAYSLTGGAYDAMQDENSVVFGGQDNYRIAMQIKSYVDNYSEAGKAAAPAISAADEIMKFKKLLDMGAINEDQYQKKLRELM